MKYSFKPAEDMAMAYGRDLNISTKQSVEICKTLRKLHLDKAKNLLEKVILKQSAIKMTRYNLKKCGGKFSKQRIEHKRYAYYPYISTQGIQTMAFWKKKKTKNEKDAH
jgi:ribosomal protein L22